MSEQSLIESDAVIKQVATQECKPALGIRKIGILGGSFNPIHNAHLRLALAAWQFLDLDQVHLMPAGQPWQKQALQVSAENRLAMLRLATQDTPQLLINTMEIERDGLTYTIDTLKELPPDAKYFWLMGSDQLNNFCRMFIRKCRVFGDLLPSVVLYSIIEKVLWYFTQKFNNFFRLFFCDD